MDIKKISKKISEARGAAKKRKFPQSIDFIVTFKDIDMKNADQQVDFYVQLHHKTTKKRKICAIVSPELKTKASEIFDTVILEEDFDEFKKNPKKLKPIVADHVFFVAQANLMPRVAATFGRVLGPRGKMPNPKAGCVIDIKTDLKDLYEKLQNLVKVSAKLQPHIQCSVGTENMEDDKLADNAYTIYEGLIHHLIKGEHNIKTAFVKLTMGPSVEVK